MISTTPAETQFWINTGRPTIDSEEGRLYWKRFHDLIKSSPIQVTVNGVFSYIESVLEGNILYGGGGFSYKFWFETEADRDAFVEEMIRVRFISNRFHVLPPI